MRKYKKQTYYSPQFKEAVMQKVFANQTRTLSSIAKEQGMPPQTLNAWVKKATSPQPSMNPTSSKTLSRFSLSQKFQLLLQSQSLQGEDFGKFLRENGLFSTDLELWKTEIAHSLTQLQLPPKKGHDPKDHKIALLEKEILLKDRTLAEASILLLLKKKHDSLWNHSQNEEKLL